MVKSQTIIQFVMTPEDLSALLDDRLSKALANYSPPPSKIDLPEYLSRKQAADALGTHARTIDRWSVDTDERKKLLTPIRLTNNTIRYHRDEILALLASNKTNSSRSRNRQ